MLTGVPYSSDLTLGAFEAGHAALVTAAKPGLLAGETAYDLSAYLVGGSNHFKLGDITNILGITVTDDGTGILIIDTTSIPIDHQVDQQMETPAPIT